METDSIGRFNTIIDASERVVFFGGAGVSTESGIPDFRSADGLYNAEYGTVRPEQVLSHSFFVAHPDDFFAYYRANLVHPEAEPGPAHLALARWETAGFLTGVVTQNIDGLHSAAGSTRVAELHGTIHSNHCLGCHRGYGLSAVLETTGAPRCGDCGGIIKPDVVLYEEALPDEPLFEAAEWIQSADTMVVAGTSLSVYPAAGLLSWFTGDSLVIINRDPTTSDAAATLVIHDSVGPVLDAVRRGHHD